MLSKSGFVSGPCRLVFLSGFLVLLTMVGWRAFAAPASDPAPVLALVGGKIMTQSSTGVMEGTILIRDGVIVAVGNVDLPSDAKKIDIQGMIVTPGLIDARSTLWLATPSPRETVRQRFRDGGGPDGDRDGPGGGGGRETAREATADGSLDALDGVDMFSDDWHEVIQQGVTAVYVQPASANIFGGRGAVLRVGPGASLEALLIKSDAGAQASLGLTAQSDSTRERHAQYEQMKKVLDSAKQYDADWKKYEEAEKQKQEEKLKQDAKPKQDEKPKQEEKKELAEAKPASSSSPAASSPATPKTKSPRRDTTKDFLRQVLAGHVPIRLESHREDDIANALKLGESYGVRVILEGVSNPRSSLEQIKSKRVPLVLGPMIELGDTPSYRKKRSDDWLTSVLSDDVRWALATFGNEARSSRLLRVHAAAAVAQGISPERVLKAITHDAAAILGVDDKLGTIAPGKRADLAIFAGDPLDPSVPVRMVLSNGRVVYEADVAPTEGVVSDAKLLGLDGQLPASFVLKTTRCLTDAGMFEPRQIVVKSGRVAAVESADKSITDLPTVDVGTAVVTPGLVVGHTDLGLGRSIDEPDDADAAYLRAVDVFDPAQPSVTKYRDGGFLGIAFAPGSTNVIAGGVGAVRPGAEQPIAAEYVAGKIVLAASSRNNERYPASLAGQLEIVDQLFSSKSDDISLLLPAQVRNQLHEERHRHVGEMLAGKRVVMIEAHSEGEIDAALRVLERHHLRGVLISPEKCDLFLPDIKRLNAGIVFRPVRADDYQRYVQTIADASKAGIPIALGSGSPTEIRMTMAMAVNAGMPRDVALKAMTCDAAKLLGLPDGVGKVQPGSPADLVIWSGSPLNLESKLLAVMLDGKVVGELLPKVRTLAPTDSRLARQREVK